MGPADLCQRDSEDFRDSEISTQCLDLEERKENSLSLHFRFFNSAAVNLLRKGLQAVCTLLSRESVILASLVCQT